MKTINKIKIETLIEATKEFKIIDAKARGVDRVPFEAMEEISKLKSKYDFPIEYCEVFDDVLESPYLEEEIREAILEVYENALLNLRTEYLGNHETEKCDIASLISSALM